MSSSCSTEMPNQRTRIESLTSAQPPRTGQIKPDSDVLRLDLSLLMDKLQKYKQDLDAAEDEINKQKSLSEKEAADLAAATRFRLELERRGGLHSDRSGHFPRSSSPASSSRAEEMISGSEHSDALSSIQGSPEIHRARQKAKRNIKAQRLEFPSMTASPSSQQFESPKTPVVPFDFSSSTSEPSLVFFSSDESTPMIPSSDPVPIPDFVEDEAAKLERRRITISKSDQEVKGGIIMSSPSSSPRRESIPPVPALPSSPSKLPKIVSNHDLRLTTLPARDDSLRWESDAVALSDNDKPDDRKLGGRGPPPKMRLSGLEAKSPEKLSHPHTSLSPSTDASPPSFPRPATTERPQMRRKKSLLSMFERKSELDKFIELYMNDDQLEEEYKPQRSTSRGKMRGLFRQNSSQTSSSVPALPPLPLEVWKQT